MIRRRKEAQRHRRLETNEEEKLLQSAEPHLQAMIIAALETCCRQGELLMLRWGDVSLQRGEIVIRAENTKDRENRIIPISGRLRQVLEMTRNSPAGVPFPASAYVFGDDTGLRRRQRQARVAHHRPESTRSHADLGLEEEERSE